jgi:hypothetical protein
MEYNGDGADKLETRRIDSDGELFKIQALFDNCSECVIKIFESLRLNIVFNPNHLRLGSHFVNNSRFPFHSVAVGVTLLIQFCQQGSTTISRGSGIPNIGKVSVMLR